MWGWWLLPFPAARGRAEQGAQGSREGGGKNENPMKMCWIPFNCQAHLVAGSVSALLQYFSPV